VSSLYTNIPTELGIKWTRLFLSGRLPPDLINLVISALTLVLNNNYFSFNDSLYLQHIGTAMGTPAAVVYANIFMYILENPVLKTYSSSILYYCRYLDDIFAILSGSPTDKSTTDFIGSLSRRHPSIKLEVTLSSSSVNFLDLRIFKGPRFATTGILDTSVHQKQLNSYLYIPFASFHPTHCKGGFIVTELKRYIRCCSNRTDFISIKHIL
jgi:hypothetical protein